MPPYGDYERRPQFGGMLMGGEGDEPDATTIQELLATTRPQRSAVAGPRGMGMAPPQESIADMVRRALGNNLRWSGDPVVNEAPGPIADPTRAAAVPTGVVRTKSDSAEKGSGTPTGVNTVGPLLGGYAAQALSEPRGAAAAPVPARRGSIQYSLDGGKTFKTYDPEGGDQIDFDAGTARQNSFGGADTAQVATPGGMGGYGSGEIVTPESEARKKRAETLPGIAADLEIEHGKRALERERPVGAELPPLTAGEALKIQSDRYGQEAKRTHAAQAYAKLEQSMQEIEQSRQRFVMNPNDPTGRSPDAYHSALEAVMRMYAADIGDPRFLPTKPREEFGAGVGQ